MFEPNTELLSSRTAPVTYRRSRHATCSWTKNPSDLTWANSSHELRVLAEATFFTAVLAKPVP